MRLVTMFEGPLDGAVFEANDTQDYLRVPYAPPDGKRVVHQLPIEWHDQCRTGWAVWWPRETLAES